LLVKKFNIGGDELLADEKTFMGQEQKAMEELRRLLLHEIVGVYGPLQGQSIGAIIIPAFIGDFKKVLDKADTSDEVLEEYMTEDRKVHLILEGRRKLGAKGVRLEITGAVVNDNRLHLTEEHCFM